jgi:uncharacterized RDD family membrane protein YckC
MNCPKCGEDCSCPAGDPGSVSADSSAAEADPLAASAESNAEAETQPSEWRNELSARLSRYRSRHKARPPRYPSLGLPFEPVPSPAQATSEDSFQSFGPASNHALALDGRHEATSFTEPCTEPERSQPPARPAEVVVPAQPVSHAGAKILEFPRFAWAPPAPPSDQLAEPVMDRPRILEVPEVEPSLPALGGITIEPVHRQEPEKRPGIDIPVQNVPLARRLFAAAIDGLLIAAAAALFGFVFWKIAAIRPPKFQIVGIAGGVTVALWAAYNYILVVYGASTPGQRAAGLQLAKFDGTPTSRSQRRWRVLASFLSAVSAGMGYAWVFLDEDALCWHDRITHTYLAAASRSADSTRS